MDAATRAELDVLRRRAYAPGADIASDPDALARLAELEDRLRRPLEEAVAPPPLPPAAAAAPTATATPSPPRRNGWHVALVACTAAAALILGVSGWEASTAPAAESGAALSPEVADSLAFAKDPDTTVLYTLHLDGAFGTYVDPYPTAVPPVTIDGPVWASALGDYYGFALWIVGSVEVEQAGRATPSPADEQLCIAMADDAVVHSRCVAREAWEQGALVLTVAFDDLPADERPQDMHPDQSLGLWWTDDDRIRVVLGRLG